MEQDTVITIRIAEELLVDLDDLRRKEKDVPTRAEMIRRLIADAAKRPSRANMESKQ